MSKKRRDLTLEEQSLWNRFVQKIKPLKSEKKHITPTSKRSIPIQRKSPLVETPSEGVKRTAIRITRTRKVKIDARLDLHGYNLEQAHMRLNQFLMSCQQNKCLWVLVITGKGKPKVDNKKTLRNQVPHWLEQSSLKTVVSAYTTSKPQDGGTGALYVRLKRLS